MVGTFYSPDGNAEIWETPPQGYIPEEEWLAQRRAEAEAAEQERLNDPALARAEKYTEINSKCELALNALTETYPDRETITFERQEREAREWQADNNASVPFITALAQNRGMEMSVLVEKILAKADLFSTASGTLIGLRQKYEDQLLALGEDATAAQIRAIEVDYTLPGVE